MSLTLLQTLQRSIALEAKVIPCRGADRDLWTSDDESFRLEAKEKCLGCPVIEECRALGEEIKATAGVWGGVDFTPRTYTRRSNPTTVPPEPGVTKTCRRCGETKPLHLFQRDHRGKEGRRASCKECTYEQRKIRERNAS